MFHIGTCFMFSLLSLVALDVSTVALVMGAISLDQRYAHISLVVGGRCIAWCIDCKSPILPVVL